MIILDSDFLSSFLKIDKLDLVKDFFKEDLFVPVAVQREISKTDLIIKMNEKRYIKIVSADKKTIEGGETLGEGETECLSLANENDLVLINDKFAGKVASLNKTSTMNISGFLLALKETEFIEVLELKKIIKDLEEKDFYSFKKEDKEKILS